MNTKQQFGDPSLPPKEGTDLESSAGKPNLALAASWVFGIVLAVG